jgi:hypothetical protein
MIFIAHRGNITGPQKDKENHPDYVQEALNLGYDVEIDVWCDNKIYLGHDEPQYEINFSFLMNNFRKLWIHCKNLEALDVLSEFKVLNYFWHESDDFTLTSKNFIWTYPGKQVTNKSVVVLDDARNYAGPICFGVCSDFLK